MANNWMDDPEFKKLVANEARHQYYAMKDNPWAAVGYANVLLTLERKEGIPLAARRLTLWQQIRARWIMLRGKLGLL